MFLRLRTCKMRATNMAGGIRMTAKAKKSDITTPPESPSAEKKDSLPRKKYLPAEEKLFSCRSLQKSPSRLCRWAREAFPRLLEYILQNLICDNFQVPCSGSQDKHLRLP